MRFRGSGAIILEIYCKQNFVTNPVRLNAKLPRHTSFLPLWVLSSPAFLNCRSHFLNRVAQPGHPLFFTESTNYAEHPSPTRLACQSRSRGVFEQAGLYLPRF